MRINCAKCGKLHDSDLTPFKHNKVPDKESITQDDVTEKGLTSGFVCEGCGRANIVLLSWYVVGD